jgi:hypothetical protein
MEEVYFQLTGSNVRRFTFLDPQPGGIIKTISLTEQELIEET